MSSVVRGHEKKYKYQLYKFVYRCPVLLLRLTIIFLNVYSYTRILGKIYPMITLLPLHQANLSCTMSVDCGAGWLSHQDFLYLHAPPSLPQPSFQTHPGNGCPNSPVHSAEGRLRFCEHSGKKWKALLNSICVCFLSTRDIISMKHLEVQWRSDKCQLKHLLQLDILFRYVLELWLRFSRLGLQ